MPFVRGKRYYCEEVHLAATQIGFLRKTDFFLEKQPAHQPLPG